MEMQHHQPGIWGSWQLAPEITIPLIVLTFLYFKGSRRTKTSYKQDTFFICGVISALIVVVTPVGARAMDYFSLHMIQHITLMMLTGPLLVLGTTKSFQPDSKFFSALTHPLFSWFSYALLMIGVHLPGPHSFIMENSWAHTYIELPLYLLLPYLFYFNLLDRKLERRRVSPALSVISLFLMMVPETLTGFFIYTSPGSLYNNMYSLDDQRRGGSLMWSGAMIIDAIWMSFAVYHWLKSEEKKSHDLDIEMQSHNG